MLLRAAAVAALAACGGSQPEPATTTRASVTAPSSIAIAAPATPPELSEAALMAHVTRLAAEDLQGRRAGTVYEKRAAEYVASELEAAKIPPPPGGKRFQTFALGGGAQSLNTYGFLRGGEPGLEREVVVLGAHVDHLGVTGGEIYRGAEDNASGVAVVLEIAKSLAQSHRQGLGRSVVLAFFGGEELGMVGSTAFVSDPPVPLGDVIAMVNIDMIARPLVDQVALAIPKLALHLDPARAVGVVGMKGRAGFRRIVGAACAATGITPVGPEDFPAPISAILEKETEARGDNWPFERAGIPALFFGSGESDDYHQPTDVPETLVPAIMAARARAILATVLALSQADRSTIRR